MLASCDCPPMGAMVVEDRWGLATRAQIDTIYDTMADFHEWTGVETVCSPGVRIRKAMPFSGGHTSLTGGMMIAIDDSYLPEIELAVRHELCHAWDISRGFPSLEHPDLFTGEDIDEHNLYPTGSLRRLESFARACQKAPEDDGFARAVDDVCGLEILRPRRRWVEEHVYREYAPTWRYAGEIALDIERVPLEGWAPWSLAVGGRRVYFLTRDEAVQIDLIDPRTGTLLIRRDAPGDDPDVFHWKLIDGQPDPLLIWSNEDQGRAWLLREDGALEEVAFAPGLGTFFVGAVRGRRAWLQGRWGEGDHGLWEVDLDSGEATPVETWYGAPMWATGMQDLGGDLLLTEVRDRTWNLVRFDPEERVASTTPLGPYPTNLRRYLMPAGVRALPDGRLVALLHAQPADGADLYLPAVLDPVDRTFRLDPATCDDPITSPGRDIFAQEARLFVLDGEVWLAEVHGGEPVLTRIGVR
ncbi:MAG: hypothetical protein ABIO70_15795 [Pseudomonadota bacterium]